MPRGYLKHTKDVGRKRNRGGGSHSVRTPGPLAKIYKGQKYDQPPYIGEQQQTAKDLCSGRHDFALAKAAPPAEKRAIHYPTGECPICLETGEVIPLSKNCKWHGFACHACLRKVHVTNANNFQKMSVCFHPQCGEPVNHSQLQKHGIIRTPEESKRHYELQLFYKATRVKEARIVYCPGCEFPRMYPQKPTGKDRVQQCKSCRESYLVSPDYATIRALERLQDDKFGRNDGWARCPSCSVLISKGDGCSHMHCRLCDCHFNWQKAVGDRLPLARPHDSDIYLWW